MSDEDFWKKRYQHTWERSDQRERAIIERVREESGKLAVAAGLGASSTEYLSGSAASRGYERGGADLQIADTDIYLEVTGPQTPAVPFTAPLWVRPDKIDNAREHYPEHETWVVHWLEKDGTLRVIKLDQDFFDELDQGAFPIVNPWIRGTRETFYEIPADHPCVRPWSELIERLREL